MGKASVVEKIVQSLSFEVEAVPQKLNQAASSSDHTPVNVKIRVRKRNEAPIQCGVISVPNVKTPVERIRLISSDQTIMSFDLQMEDENDKKPLRKPRKRIFDILKPGGCFNTENDEDEYQYLPATSYNANLIKESFNSNSDGVLKQNFTLPRRNSDDARIIEQKNNQFLGKCKPGGCLDPPFSEEKYPYKLASKKHSALSSIIKDVNANSKIDTGYKSKVLDVDKNLKKVIIENNLNVSKGSSKRDIETNSVLSLYKTESLKTSMSMSYSNSIITYPPELTSSQMHLQEEKNVKKRESDDKSRNSFMEFTDIYFPPKNTTNRKIVTNISVPEHSESKDHRTSFLESKKHNDVTIDKENGPVKNNEETENDLREIRNDISELGYTKVNREENIPFILPNITVHPMNAAASNTDIFPDTQTDIKKNFEKKETKFPSFIKFESKLKIDVPILNSSAAAADNADSEVLKTKEKRQEPEHLEIEQDKSFENVKSCGSIEVKDYDDKIRSNNKSILLNSIPVNNEEEQRVNENLNNMPPYKKANDSLDIHSETLSQTISRSIKFEPEPCSSQIINLKLVTSKAMSKIVNNLEDITINPTKLKTCDNLSMKSFNEINLTKDQAIEVLNPISLQTKQIYLESLTHINQSDQTIKNHGVNISTESMAKLQDKYLTHQIIDNKQAEPKDELSNYKTMETFTHKSKGKIINDDVDVLHNNSIITSNTIFSITREDFPLLNQNLKLDINDSTQEVLSKRQSIPCKTDKNMNAIGRHTSEENQDKMKISSGSQIKFTKKYDEEMIKTKDLPNKNISHEDRIMNLKNTMNSENIKDTTSENLLDGGIKSGDNYKKNIPSYEKLSQKECTKINNTKAIDMGHDDDDNSKVMEKDILNTINRSKLVMSNESEAIDSISIDKVASSLNIIPNNEAERYSQRQIKNIFRDSLDTIKIEILEKIDKRSRTSSTLTGVIADNILIKNETTSLTERTKTTSNDLIIETSKSYNKTDNNLQNLTDDLKSPLYFEKKISVSENLSYKRHGENSDIDIIENKGLNKNKQMKVDDQDTPNNLIIETIKPYDKTNNFAQNLTNNLSSPLYVEITSIMSENLSNIRHDENSNLDIIENKKINQNEEIKVDDHDTPNNLTIETIKSYDKIYDNNLRNLTDELNSPLYLKNKSNVSENLSNKKHSEYADKEIKDGHGTPNNLIIKSIQSCDNTDNYLQNLTDDLNSPLYFKNKSIVSENLSNNRYVENADSDIIENKRLNENKQIKVDVQDTPNNFIIETIKLNEKTNNFAQNLKNNLSSPLYLKNTSFINENLNNIRHGENSNLDIIENKIINKNEEIKIDDHVGTSLECPNNFTIETIKSYEKIYDNKLRNLTDELNSPLYLKNKSNVSENLSNKKHSEYADLDFIENKELNKNEEIKDGHGTPNNLIIKTIQSCDKADNYLQNLTDDLNNPLYFKNKSIVSENLSNKSYGENADLNIIENKILNKNEEMKVDDQDTPNNLIIETIKLNDKTDNFSQNITNDLYSPLYFEKKTILSESPSYKRYGENAGLIRSAMVSNIENKRLNKSEEHITTYKIDTTDGMENIKHNNISDEKKSTTESVLAKGISDKLVNQQDYNKRYYTPLSLKGKTEINHEISETVTFSRALSNSISEARKLRKSINDKKIIEPSHIFMDKNIVEPNISVTEIKEIPDGKSILLKPFEKNKINTSQEKYSEGYDERSLTSCSKPTTKILNNVNKNDKISVDLAFQTFVNDQNEIVFKTFDSINEPVRYQDDHLTIIKSQMGFTDTELRIPMNTENDMSVKIIKTNIFNRDPQANEISNNDYHPAVSINCDTECANQNMSVKYGDKSESDEKIHGSLITIYEQELVPLQKVIKSLKDDIDSLADQQIFLKDKLLNPRRSKLKLMHFNRKCGCHKRY